MQTSGISVLVQYRVLRIGRLESKQKVALPIKASLLYLLLAILIISLPTARANATSSCSDAGTPFIAFAIEGSLTGSEGNFGTYVVSGASLCGSSLTNDGTLIYQTNTEYTAYNSLAGTNDYAEAVTFQGYFWDGHSSPSTLAWGWIERNYWCFCNTQSSDISYGTGLYPTNGATVDIWNNYNHTASGHDYYSIKIRDRTDGYTIWINNLWVNGKSGGGPSFQEQSQNDVNTMLGTVDRAQYYTGSTWSFWPSGATLQQADPYCIVENSATNYGMGVYYGSTCET